MGYRFVPECNHAQESHTCQFFRCFPAIFAGRRFVDATPWQRDVTTFSLHCTWIVPGAGNVCDKVIAGCSRTCYW